MLVGDLDVEGLLKGHDQFDRVERVGAQVVHERSLGRDLRLVHAQLLDDDLFYAFFNRCHETCKLLFASPLPAASVPIHPACLDRFA